VRYVRDLQRSTTNRIFEDLLDEFYRRRASGESPKLKDMANEYERGAHYGALRKYKMGYDAELKRLREE
jgi:hypothetical protein